MLFDKTPVFFFSDGILNVEFAGVGAGEETPFSIKHQAIDLQRDSAVAGA